MNNLRNPNPMTLVFVTVAVIIPLFWPVTLYVWLRFLTGHRSSSAAEPVSWNK